MASDAANIAQAHMASASCVARFNQGSDVVAQLAALKNASSYQRGAIVKGGWVTMPGDPNLVAGAADICAQTQMTESPLPTAKG